MSIRGVTQGLAAILLAALIPASAPAAPVLGFVESFTGDPNDTWNSQAILSNPGTGGVLGASDGYMLITRSTANRWGAHSLSPAPFLLAGSPVDGRGLRPGVLADVAPTLLELLGLSPAPGMTGGSLLVDD